MMESVLVIPGKIDGKPESSRPPGNYFVITICQIWSLFLGICTTVWNTILFDIYKKYPKIDMSNPKSGQTCVLTGGSRGIGIEILKKLLQLDYTVIAGVRNMSLVEEKVKEFRKSGVKSGKAILLHLDLKSLKSVTIFTRNLLKLPDVKGINLLINNAGVGQTDFEVTEDGLEAHFQVNYLSHYLLTKLLLPVMKHTAEAKLGSCHIVNVSSCYHQNGNVRKRLSNLVKPTKFVPIQFYFDTKLCQVMHAKTIQAQLEDEGVTNVQMYAVHPGNIPTEMWIRTMGCLKPFNFILKLILRSAETAANVVVHPAVSPGFSENCGGKYFDTGRAISCNSQANDPNLRRRLIDISENLIADFAYEINEY